MVASTLGSSTSTFWKRRSSAASFSMYFRYSLSVVAPMQCSSPLASAGFSMLPASIAPSALPAPTMVCSSSMKMIVLPSSLASSFSTDFSRSSNSPRYLAPASSDAMSSTRRRLFFRLSGTSSLTMRCARPSTIAVLPTPGSPISTGLFFVRRCRIWMQRRISSSRPMTGSSLPWRARSVRSSVYFDSAWRCDSSACPCTVSPPRTSSTAFSSAAFVTPACLSTRPVSPLSAAAASRKSSEAMYWSPRFCASLSATFKRFVRSRPIITSPGVPWTFGRRATASAALFLSVLALPPALAMRPAMPSSATSAASRWGGSMYWLSLPSAALCASARASWSLVVSLSKRISMILWRFTRIS